MNLSGNIKTIRKEKRLTQEQLAEAMGVSAASVSKWETGQALPELSVLTELADFFEVSIDALMGHKMGGNRLEEKVAALIATTYEEGKDGEAMAAAEDLLRRYPNELSVIKAATEVYYKAYICIGVREYMEKVIELIKRQFLLLKSDETVKILELKARLANCYELPENWEKARKYYEESNVSGVNEGNLAKCMMKMGDDEKALTALSDDISNTFFNTCFDIFNIAEIWERRGEPKKAAAALHLGLAMITGMGSKTANMVKGLEILMLLDLAKMEEQLGENDLAAEHKERAEALEHGLEHEPTEEFLCPKKPHYISGLRRENADGTPIEKEGAFE